MTWWKKYDFLFVELIYWICRHIYSSGKGGGRQDLRWPCRQELNTQFPRRKNLKFPRRKNWNEDGAYFKLNVSHWEATNLRVSDCQVKYLLWTLSLNISQIISKWPAEVWVKLWINFWFRLPHCQASRPRILVCSATPGERDCLHKQVGSSWWHWWHCNASAGRTTWRLSWVSREWTSSGWRTTQSSTGGRWTSPYDRDWWDQFCSTKNAIDWLSTIN